MKFYVPFLFFFLLPLCSSAKTINFVSADTTNRRIHCKKNGYWEKHRLNGNLKSQGYYTSGKRNGDWKFYAKDGKSYDEGRLVNGHKIGRWYLTGSDGTRLDATDWDGKGHCVGGATLSW